MKLNNHGLNSVLNVKALVGIFNQEKALVGTFSVIVKTNCETNGSFNSTRNYVTLCFCQIMECPGTEGGVFVLMIKRPRENGNIIAYLFLQHFPSLNWNDRVAV